MNDSREPVRLLDWLASRSPQPPSMLGDLLRTRVGDATCSRAELPSTLLEHATRILSSVRDDRSYAAELLAADAFVSYAVEAAADDCGDLEGFAARAAVELASQ